MRSTRISFPTSDDVLLSGSLDLPEGKPRAHALFANCFSCSSQSHAARRIGQALAQHGIATLRFDFTGLGASDGAFADSHFVANIEDLKAAVRATAGPIPLLLVGHSLGGAAAIAAANEIPSVRAIATLGAPFDPAHALRHFGYALAEIERNGAGEVQIGDQERERRKAMLRRSRKRPTAIGGTIVHAGVTSKL